MKSNIPLSSVITISICMSVATCCRIGGLTLRYVRSAPCENDKRNQTVYENMLEVQKAARFYAQEHHGTFPPTVEELKFYFPFGNPITKQPGIPVVNPFTNQAEWPTAGHITDVKAARKSPLNLKPGEVQYNSFNLDKSYVIIGGMDTQTTEVLSNE